MSKVYLTVITICLPFLFLSQTREEIFQDARQAYNNNDIETAKTLFEKYIELDNTNADAFYYLGMTKSRNFLFGGFDEFDKAIQLNPNHVNALLARGNYYSYTSESKKALKDYLHAHELQPEHSGILYNLAGAKKTTGDIAGALSDYTTLIEGNYNDKMHALVDRGKIYLDQKQYEKAISDFESAIEERYPFYDVYEGLGDACFKLKKLDSACNYWDKGIKLCDSDMNNCEELTNKIEKNCK